MRALLSATVFAFLGPGQSMAGDAVGTWLTEADRHGQRAHVVAEPCGSAICGTIRKVVDSGGKSVNAPTLGVRVFWDMQQSGNEYRGRAYVPARKKEYDARMQVTGDRMKVGGCFAGLCLSQIWTRVD